MNKLGEQFPCDICGKTIIRKSPSHKRCERCKLKPFRGNYQLAAQKRYYARQRGEKCQICKHRFLSAWSVSDKLWQHVTNIKNERGRLCQKCFEKLADTKNIKIYWEARLYENNNQ